MNEENANSSGFELWLYDLSIDPATRVAGAILIIAGSALGAMLGVLLMAADPADIIGQIEDEKSSDDVLYVKPSETYLMKTGDVHFYDIGDVHSPVRKDPVRLLRIEGTNLDNIKRSNIKSFNGEESKD